MSPLKQKTFPAKQNRPKSLQFFSWSIFWFWHTYSTNHSLTASTCTYMFHVKKDEQMIKHVSGHKSDAVRVYKHVNDKLRQKASTAIQGIFNESSVTTSKSSGVVTSIIDGSNSDDFMPCSQVQNKSLKCKTCEQKHVTEGSDSGFI